MNIAIIHLADLHYSERWIEDQGVVLDVFFKDLGQHVEKLDGSNVYLAFSGDVVQAGANSDLYDKFIQYFDSKLNSLKIPKNRRICVPGNHDISIEQISSKRVEHEGVVSQNLDECEFNDYVSNPTNVFTDKFSQYSAFEPKFAEHGSLGSTVTGAGREIVNNIGVYCLNTVLCCSGGLKDKDGQRIVDKRRLAIDTRSLQAWNINCKAQCKILIMHHPIDWLTEWAQRELKTILRKDFNLCLSGHSHDQSVFHSISDGSHLIECSAPPLFAKKTGDLGYSIITVSPDKGVIDIAYRQWTKHKSFVAGVSFSNTDSGKVIILKQEEIIKTIEQEKKPDVDFVDRYLTKKLDDALVSFSSQPKVWVEPILNKTAEVVKDADSDGNVNLIEFISNPKSTIIKALPQFGLTCLAHHLIREAWRTQGNAIWLYLDSKNLKPYPKNIKKAIDVEINLLGCKVEDVKCVILDSWTSTDDKAQKLLQNICTLFKDFPVIVMHTIDNSRIWIQTDKENLGREFEVLYLWALPRGHVRNVVAKYNEKRPVGDENLVIKRLVTDLEVLNLHRTPLNCLTLLKVLEIDFDESPVNRTELLKRILFLLFNVDDIPTYKVRPDLKDCEYVLGYFCETLLRNKEYFFTMESFLGELQTFCEKRVIDLEIQAVFDVLYTNNILIKSGNLFCFRYTYWIFFFAAQRMHHDQDFTKFIYDDKLYVQYPEIIEFYTGIDRRREDALRVLIEDIQTACDKVETKCGLPEELNPYRWAQWRSSEETLQKMRDEISDGVLNSKLPESVKDHYADRTYDRARPYCQSIEDLLGDYSFVFMMLATKAGARALRNSDYVNPDSKLELLRQIMRSWKQISKVLLITGPMMAVKGSAIYDGAAFFLSGDFGDTPNERLGSILSVIPYNVVSWYIDDIYSAKMGPLLTKQLVNENDELNKHKLILLLIRRRPRDWKKYVQKYIESVKKNSFYLFDVYNTLRTQYRYSFASSQTLKDIEYLIKMALIKHMYGTKKPGTKVIKKFKKQVLPVRDDNLDTDIGDIL